MNPRVIDRRAALQALKSCYAHLESGGQLALTASPTNRDYYCNEAGHAYPSEWQIRSKKKLPDGRQLLIYHRKIWEDTVEQVSQQERRYELYRGDRLLEEEVHIGQTRWYRRNELLWMLELAGFCNVVVKGGFTEEDLNENHEDDMVFLATKNADA